MNREFIFEKEKISRAVLKISTPSAVSSVATVIYNIIDTIFIGRCVGTIGITAISVYLPIQMMILSLTTLFAAGIGSLASRELGRKNQDTVEKATGTLIAFIGTIAIILVIIGLLFTSQIVSLFGAHGAALSYSITYAKVMFIGILFYPFCSASNNILRAEGATKNTMIGTIISIVSNIILDYVFIVLFHWGVMGAGLATTLSKLINFIYIVYYFKFKSSIKIKLANITYDFKILRKAIPIGFATFLNQFAGSISIMLLNQDLYHFGGNYAIAVYGIVFKLTSLIQKAVIGFTKGTGPIIGYNYGAKNPTRIKGALKWSLIYSSVLAIGVTIIMIVFSKYFIELFTSDSSLISYSSKILIIALLASPLLGIYFLSITFYRSTGKAKESIILSLFRRVFFFMPFLYLFPYTFHLGLMGVWIVLPLSNFLSAMFGGGLLLRDLKKQKQVAV